MKRQFDYPALLGGRPLLTRLRSADRIAVRLVTRAGRRAGWVLDPDDHGAWVPAVWAGWWRTLTSVRHRKRLWGSGACVRQGMLRCPPPGVQADPDDRCRMRTCLFCWSRRAGQSYARLAAGLRADPALLPVRVAAAKPVRRVPPLLNRYKPVDAVYVHLPGTPWAYRRQEAVGLYRAVGPTGAGGRPVKNARPVSPDAAGLAAAVLAAYRYPVRWLKDPAVLAAARIGVRKDRYSKWFTAMPARPATPLCVDPFVLHPAAFGPVPPADSRLSSDPVHEAADVVPDR